MKKTFAVIAAVLFVLSFAASAFAIHAEIPAETQAVVAKGATQITLGGEIRFRGWYYNNMAPYWANAVPGNPEDSNDKANYDMRVRLFVDANISPNVRGFIHLETGNTGADTTDILTFGNLNTKSTGVNTILEAWLQYSGSGLFGFPAFIKMGHMPLKLSEGVFFDNTQFGDDAIVFAMDPTKELHIGLLTIKASEGLTGRNTDDLDAYVALMTYKLAPTHTLGLNYTYINRSSDEIKFSNVGIHANGTSGNFGYKAEADFQFGDYGAGSSNADFEGWAAAVKLNYKMDQWNLRGAFGYGSGDDSGKDNKEFQTLVGTIQHFTFVYDYRARAAGTNQYLSGRNNTTGSGLANTTVYNLGVDYAATKALGFTLDGYVLRASKTTSGISKDIGWELDASMKYQLAKNLTYQINVGYLDGGDWFEEKAGGVSSAKAATIVNNILTLSF